MKILWKLSFAAFAYLLVGCIKENVALTPDSPDKEPTAKFTATLENDALTRIYLVGEELLWDADEVIAVFDDYPFVPACYELDNMTCGTSRGEFMVRDYAIETEPGNLNGWHVAINPYSQYEDAGEMVCLATEHGSAENMTFTVQSLNLASEQIWYSDGGLGFTFPMMAISRNDELNFRNLCGLLRVQLWGTHAVSKITLQGNNNEIIAGAFDAQMNTKSYVPTLIPKEQGGQTKVTVTCNEPRELIDDQGQPYWFTFSIAPTVFTKGFTVTVYTANGGVKTFSTEKRIEVPRSVLVNMAPQQVVLSE